MVKRDRCTESGYSLIEVITVLALVGLVVGLAFGAYSFVVKAYARGSDQTLFQQDARAVVGYLEKELIYSQRIAAYSSSEAPPVFDGSFLEMYSAGNAVLVNGRPVFSADGMEYELSFHRVEESRSLLKIEVTIHSSKTQRNTRVAKTVKLLNAQLEGSSGDRIRYVK